MKCFSRFALALLVSTSLTAAAYAANINDETIADTDPQPIAESVMKVEKPEQKQEDPKSPVAKPVSAWLVGPSQASQFDTKEKPDELGCLMVAEFDNGMIIGIHARQAGIVGMTVDTGKPTLAVGTMKQVGLNIGPDAFAMNAMASDASTLSLDLKEAGGGRAVVEHLTKLGNFRILIDEKPNYFATTGFTDGLARLQACMGGMVAITMPVVGPGDDLGKIDRIPSIESKKVTSSGTDTPLALAMPELIPTGYKFTMQDVDPMTPVSWQAGGEWTDVMRTALAAHNLKMSIKGNEIFITKRTGESDPVIESDQKHEKDIAEVNAIPPIMADEVPPQTKSKMDAADEMVGVWGGAKGENLASVLDAWGLMAGVKMKVDLVGDLRLPQDVRYEGRFDEAVQKLLGQFSGPNRPVGEFKGTSLASALSSPPPVAIKQDATPRAPDAAPPAPKLEEPKREPWKPMAPEQLAAMAKDAQARWTPVLKAPVKQMDIVPDTADAPKVVSAETKSKKEPVKSAKTMGTWQALQGTSLRDALEHWAVDAKVDVIWQTDDNFPLPETMKSKGTFEDAVMEALEQYAGQGLQPSAQLNQDPNTGKKALIIKTKGK